LPESVQARDNVILLPFYNSMGVDECGWCVDQIKDIA
jgi:hypothetical protein